MIVEFFNILIKNRSWTWMSKELKDFVKILLKIAMLVIYILQMLEL